MSSNTSQLLLLADHVKLSLLERQRAISLNLQPNSRDGEISRSLDALRDGLERLESTSNLSPDNPHQALRLRQQYNELQAQFTGSADSPTSETMTKPNDSTLSSDFASAQTLPPKPSASSLKKKTSDRSISGKRNVRFTDHPSEDEEERGAVAKAAETANHAALFPYRDNPDEDAPPDHAHLDNQQVHEYHTKVLREQDEQLDQLGASIGRQRELGVRIGEELDDHMEILDDVEQGVDRHQSQLDRARKRLGGVARKAKDNISWTVIILLIILLLLLIVVL